MTSMAIDDDGCFHFCRRQSVQLDHHHHCPPFWATGHLTVMSARTITPRPGQRSDSSTSTFHAGNMQVQREKFTLACLPVRRHCQWFGQVLTSQWKLVVVVACWRWHWVRLLQWWMSIWTRRSCIGPAILCSHALGNWSNVFCAGWLGRFEKHKSCSRNSSQSCPLLNEW